MAMSIGPIQEEYSPPGRSCQRPVMALLLSAHVPTISTSRPRQAAKASVCPPAPETPDSQRDCTATSACEVEWRVSTGTEVLVLPASDRGLVSSAASDQPTTSSPPPVEAPTLA